MTGVCPPRIPNISNSATCPRRLSGNTLVKGRMWSRQGLLKVLSDNFYFCLFALLRGEQCSSLQYLSRRNAKTRCKAWRSLWASRLSYPEFQSRLLTLRKPWVTNKWQWLSNQNRVKYKYHTIWVFIIEFIAANPYPEGKEKYVSG